MLPVITKEYTGEELYNHVRTRYKRINMNLKKLVLQGNNQSREVISQVLGHRNLATTNVYLDSFKTDVLDHAANLL